MKKRGGGVGVGMAIHIVHGNERGMLRPTTTTPGEGVCVGGGGCAIYYERRTTTGERNHERRTFAVKAAGRAGGRGGREGGNSPDRRHRSPPEHLPHLGTYGLAVRFHVELDYGVPCPPLVEDGFRCP